jgi:hypothetical protein
VDVAQPVINALKAMTGNHLFDISFSQYNQVLGALAALSKRAISFHKSI